MAISLLREAKTSQSTFASELSDCFGYAYKYIENRILSVRKDFETPNKFNLSYGESSMLLDAYTELSTDIAIMLHHVRNKVNNLPDITNRSLFLFAMVDFTSEVRLRIFKPKIGTKKENSYRYGFFQLPSGAIYDVKNIIAFMFHEAGHKIAIDKNERNRNFLEQFFPSVLDIQLRYSVRDMLKELKLNHDDTTTEIIINWFMQHVFGNHYRKSMKDDGWRLDAKCFWEYICKPCSEDKTCKNENNSLKCETELKSLVEHIYTFLNAYLPKLASHPKFKQVDEKKVLMIIAKMIRKAEEEIGGYHKLAWKEASADFFMIKMLKIDFEDYMDILDEMKKTNPDLHNCNLPHLVRFSAISMIIKKDNGEKFSFDNFRDLANKIMPDFNEKYPDELAKASIFRCAKSLAKSLNATFTKDNNRDFIKILENNTSSKEKLEKIRKDYESLCKNENDDKFYPSIKFIENYQQA